MQLEPDDRRGAVLVVHPDRKAQRVLHRIVAATLRPVEIVEVAAAERAAPETVVVVDLAVARAMTSAPGPRWIAVPGDDARPATPEDIAALLEAGWSHVLGAPLSLCQDELIATAQKLLRPRVFGLECYLGWSAALRTVTLEDAIDRTPAVAALVAGVNDAGLSERVASLASVIADELLANAIYDAPIDAGGAHSHHGAPRDQARALDRPVTLRWGCDARLLALEVGDGWGTLAPSVPGPLIARATRRVRTGDGGMGLALAYACCHQLVVGIAPRRRTELIALIDVRHRPTEVGRAPSFHLFVEEVP